MSLLNPYSILGAAALGVALFVGGCRQGQKLQEGKDLKILQAERSAAVEDAKKVRDKWQDVVKERDEKFLNLQNKLTADAEKFETDEALAEIAADKTTQKVNRDVRENPMSLSCALTPNALRLRNEAIRKSNDPTGGVGSGPGEDTIDGLRTEP